MVGQIEVWRSGRWFLRPSQDKAGIYEDVENDFLAIGWPGIDGVMFGYRRHMAGLWACNPGENYFREMADDLDGLQDGWTNGTLAV